MAIEKAAGPGGDAPFDPLGSDIALPEEEEDVVVTETNDGTIFDFSGEEETSQEDKLQGVGWYDNLADVLEEGELQAIGRKVIDLFDGDDMSREDWKKTYIDGLTLLGFKPEQRTDPWMGACGVYHPVMTEAAVRFQSQAIMEIFPAGGPVRTKILGKWTKEKEQQARRVEEEMNYTVTEKMVEFRAETEMLLFYLSLAGSGFRKTYYDKRTKRPKSCFVPAEDFVVPYGTTSLESAPRFTHIIRTYLNDIKKDQESGFYRDVDVPEPPIISNNIQEKKDRITGENPFVGAGRDDRYTILECHIELDFEDKGGVARPYIVWVDRFNPIVLGLRRNWKEGDAARNRLKHFVAYRYLPGLSFYGSGLIHLIGGITQAVTSIQRQLVDAGTLNNLPGGLKSRGLRINGDDTPIMPGEFRDVDVLSGTIRDNITFIPYKEPSQVLHALMKDLVEEGRRLGAAPDLPISAMGGQGAPVGTTLALLERSMKIMSAVQARLHASLKEDFKLIAEVISEQGENYEYPVEDPKANRQTDFSQVDILPVSDPNAASQAYRIIQYQTLIDAVRIDPTGWDLPKIKADFAAIIGIPNANSLLKNPDDVQAMDPVSENMAVLNGKPVKAFLWQDHEAHIQVHLAAVHDPKIAQMVGQSPNASMVMGAAMAHITEHLAFQYRREIEKQMGVELPPPDQPLPPEVEVRLSKLVAQAAHRLLRKDMAEQKQQQIQQQQQDPVLQMQQKELQLKEMDIQRKTKEFEAKLRLEAFKVQNKTDIDRARLDSSERIAGAALGKDIAESHATFENDAKDRAIDVAKELMDLKARAEELRVQEESNKRQSRRDVH